VEHTAKCSWVPAKQAKWLGFRLDLELEVVSVHGEKIAALKSQLVQATGKDSLKARELASIIGKIVNVIVNVNVISNCHCH